MLLLFSPFWSIVVQVQTPDWLFVPVLQALDDTVANEEKTLVHIESLAEVLRSSTSPAGAALVAEEAEELRQGWQDLRLGLAGAQQDLHTSLDTHSQYLGRCQDLRGDLRRLRENMQELQQQLEDTQEAGRSAQEEEQLVGHWRRYTVGLLGSVGWWTEPQSTWTVDVGVQIHIHLYIHD